MKDRRDDTYHEAGVCKTSGCLKNTHDLKPFCVTHILMGSYAAKVSRELECQKIEKEHLKNWGRIYEDCHYIDEVIICLNDHGLTSVGKLAQYLGLEKNTMQRVINYMKVKSIVKSSTKGVVLR